MYYWFKPCYYALMWLTTTGRTRAAGRTIWSFALKELCPAGRAKTYLQKSFQKGLLAGQVRVRIVKVKTQATIMWNSEFGIGEEFSLVTYLTQFWKVIKPNKVTLYYFWRPICYYYLVIIIIIYVTFNPSFLFYRLWPYTAQHACYNSTFLEQFTYKI